MALIEYEQQGHVVTIALNRPERLNAIGAEIRDELSEAWMRFDGDDEARVAILTGRGRAFCVGRDLKESLDHGHSLPPAKYPQMRGDLLTPAINKPIIGAVHGYAIAAGFVMALGCDLIVAAEGTRFQMQQLRHGGTIGHYTAAILEQLPWQAAMEVILLGAEIDAARGRELGFVNLVVPEAELLDRATEVATELAALPPVHVQKTKELMERVRPRPSDEIREAERQVREHVGALADTRESMQAWVERRPPVYRGR